MKILSLLSLFFLSTIYVTHAAVLFQTSGGYLSAIQFTEALDFTVNDDVTTTTGVNGYKLVLQDAYTGLGGYTFVDATGPSITVNAERAGGVAQDWTFTSSQVQRGFSGLDIVPADLHVRFVVNNLSDFAATLGTSIAIPTSSVFTLDNSTTVEAPNDFTVGGSVNLFIATTYGKQITDVIQINIVPEPSSAILLGLAGVSLLSLRRRIA